MIKPSRSVVAGLVLTASLLVGIATKEVYVGDAMIPVPGDVPTLGYGATEGVKMGDKTTPDRALVRLLTDANKYADGVKGCVKVPLYQHEFDAYVSLAYNVGVGAVCNPAKPGKPPNLIDLINAGRYDDACRRILKFNGMCLKRVAGKCVDFKVLRGLDNRRKAEFKTCMGVG